jgi:YspA, cpYpsA-related SLOG family
MRIIVCGGRDFIDKSFLFMTLDRIRKERNIIHVIEGGQRTRDPHTREIVGGADYFAMRWAKLRGVDFTTVKANWETDGKAAGPIRNSVMLLNHAPDAVVAFPGGKGTADMVAKARKKNVEVIEIKI